MIYFGINIVTHKVYFLNSRMNSYIKQLHGYDYGFFSIEKNRKKWEYKFYKDIDNIYMTNFAGAFVLLLIFILILMKKMFIFLKIHSRKSKDD